MHKHLRLYSTLALVLLTLRLPEEPLAPPHPGPDLFTSESSPCSTTHPLAPHFALPPLGPHPAKLPPPSSLGGRPRLSPTIRPGGKKAARPSAPLCGSQSLTPQQVPLPRRAVNLGAGGGGDRHAPCRAAGTPHAPTQIPGAPRVPAAQPRPPR